jgi:hypothetical protein
MKQILYFTRSLIFAALLMPCVSNAQKTIASPRDSVTGKIGDAKVSINYGSPSVKGREIWGKLVPYGKVWRSGANEATTFTTDKPLLIEGKELPAGEYAFFTLPGEKKWTVIFNKVAKQWGAFEYSDKEDALRVEVSPKKADKENERLVYKISDNKVSLLWEQLEVPLTAKSL